MADPAMPAQFSPDTSTGKAAGGESAPAAGQAWSEERVLGALIQQHPETGQVLAMLPGTVFTSPLRREIFEVIRSLHVGKRPVDALTVDWELARCQATSGIRGEAPAGAGESYAARLARLNTGDGPVTGTARALLTRVRPSRKRLPASDARPGRAAALRAWADAASRFRPRLCAIP